MLQLQGVTLLALLCAAFAANFPDVLQAPPLSRTSEITNIRSTSTAQYTYESHNLTGTRPSL